LENNGDAPPGVQGAEPPDYLESYDNVSSLLTKKPSFSYSVGQRGHNEQRKEYHGNQNQSAGCGVGAVAEAGESRGDWLYDSGSPPTSREDGSAENVSSWLASTCDKEGVGWFVAGECPGGHRFAKELVCGKEWCEVCGEDGSVAHNRRFVRWLPKVEQLGTMGYFVFTLPESIRGEYRTKKALARLGHQVQELLKRYGYSRGLRRWHFFGDRSTRWHPHLNVLVDGGFAPPRKLEAIKRGYASLLGVDLADVNYHYRTSPGRMVHTLKYVTRATFRDWGWDVEMALELRRFRNAVSWGYSFWDAEPAWSLAELKGKARATVEGLDVQAVESLVGGVCPVCGKPIKWGEVLPIGLLNMVEKTDQGAGYWRLPDGRPKFSALTDADRRVLAWLERIHRAVVQVAMERARREAAIEAEYQAVLWRDLLN